MKNAVIHVQRLRLLASFCLGVALISLACFFIWKSQGTMASPAVQERGVETIVDLTQLTLEIRDTDEGRRQGLSGRESLGRNEGMLFLFNEPALYPFWMKDMKFDIDIIWMLDGRVVDVVTLPPPGPGELIPPSHVPKAKADSVLELDAGRAQELEIVPGVILNMTSREI
jgi:uncharacterized membrane protein (UPF0127 family)